MKLQMKNDAEGENLPINGISRRDSSTTANTATNKRTTEHEIVFTSAQRMTVLKDATVDLVVTSPPYPMIEMWDNIFANQSRKIAEVIQSNPSQAFELMHTELDKVWTECFRVLKDGGILCVNIGDATRTINGNFQLHNNHSRIESKCHELGFVSLPGVIWRKQSNAPNKFMGSGMLPCCAYITLEHEWILVFRKGEKRVYKTEKEKLARRESAFFWEERNIWFSDVWDVKGVRQTIANSETRDRNASFPMEIPFRIINMFSQCGDTVLDPFIGLGTTSLAAMMTGRNSIGFEIDSAMRSLIEHNIDNWNPQKINAFIRERYMRHLTFVKEWEEGGKELKYYNGALNCKVMTAQETDIRLDGVERVTRVFSEGLGYICDYHHR